MEPGDGLDCFPSILFASGFTGVTYTENNENKRELGRLICYPENDSNEINDERIIQCEQRRQFAKTKKEQFIRRCKFFVFLFLSFSFFLNLTIQCEFFFFSKKKKLLN